MAPNPVRISTFYQRCTHGPKGTKQLLKCHDSKLVYLCVDFHSFFHNTNGVMPLTWILRFLCIWPAYTLETRPTFCICTRPMMTSMLIKFSIIAQAQDNLNLILLFNVMVKKYLMICPMVAQAYAVQHALNAQLRLPSEKQSKKIHEIVGQIGDWNWTISGTP